MVAVLAMACAPPERASVASTPWRTDFRARIANLVEKEGFEQEVFSEPEGGSDLETFRIKLSLDGVRARHLSVDKLMRGLGALCGDPRFSMLPITIVLAIEDEDDRMHLFALALSETRKVSNVAVDPIATRVNEIRVVVRHPAVRG